MTGAEALSAAIARLRAAGVDEPARDARALLANAMGIERGRLVLELPATLPPGVAARFEDSVAAREARQPVSQIVGRRMFYGRPFRVTRDVLDPRPETELIVELALGRGFSRILDLGTGSGAILLSCLAEREDATGLGTDISESALGVAQENAARLGVAARAMFRQADWWEGMEGRFDIVVSNPPYIAEAEMAGLAPELLGWEPRGALTPGGDGLSAYRRIAEAAPRHLAAGGRLIVEIGAAQGDAVPEILRAAGLEDIALHHDLDRRPRAVTADAPDGAVAGS